MSRVTSAAELAPETPEGAAPQCSGRHGLNTRLLVRASRFAEEPSLHKGQKTAGSGVTETRRDPLGSVTRAS